MRAVIDSPKLHRTRASAATRARGVLVLLLALAACTARRPSVAAPSPPPDRAYVYVGGRSEIAVYALDRGSGALVHRGTVPAGTRASYLAFSPAGTHAYAIQNSSPGKILDFTMDGATGALTRVGEVLTGNGELSAGASHLVLHPSGRWVLAAHLASGHLSVHPLAADGRIEPSREVRLIAKGAHQVITDGGGRHVLVPCRDSNLVAQYLFDAETGTLTPNDHAAVPALAPRTNPRHIALHPSERFAYVINEAAGTMTSYQYDAATGRLSAPETVPTVPDGCEETGTGHVLVHPSGKFVYGSNRFHDTLVIYAVDGASGRLTPLDFEAGLGLLDFPRDFDIDPTGRFLVVINEQADTVLVFRIDQATGRLTPAGPAVPTVAQPLYAGVYVRP